MIAPNIKVEAESAIRAFARLKGVNVYLVVFNAMKDFVSEAYKATPVAKVARSGSLWAILPKKKFPRVKKEKQFVPIRGTQKQVEHLMKQQVKVAQYWSKTSWIAAMRLLGFQAKGSSSDQKAAFEDSSYLKKWHRKNKTAIGENIEKGRQARHQSALESITIIDKIGFDNLSGAEQSMIAAGEQKAAMNIAKEWDRQLKKQWK